MGNSLEKAIDVIIRSVDPDKIILFGSRARGDYKKESDYDICVIKKGVEHRRKLAQRIYGSFMVLEYLLILSLKLLSGLMS